MKRSSSKSMAAAASPPLRGGCGWNRYSARQPRRATCQGSAASAMALAAPSANFSASGIMWAKAAGVSTCFSVAGHQFDVVLNLVRTSPEETAQLAGLVADGGVFVSTTTPGPQDAGRGVRTVQVFLRSDAAQLAELSARVDAGGLRIVGAEAGPL